MKTSDWTTIAQMLRTFRMMNSSLSLETVLENVMDAAMVLIGAERGLLSLKRENGLFEPKIRRQKAAQPLSQETLKVRQTHVEEAIRLRKIISTRDITRDGKRMNSGISDNVNLRSIVCCPLLKDEDVLGFIYADSGTPLVEQSEIKEQIFQLFADQAALAIRNAQYYQNENDSFLENAARQESLIFHEKIIVRDKTGARIGNDLKYFLSSAEKPIQRLRTFAAGEGRDDPAALVPVLKYILGLIGDLRRYSRELLFRLDESEIRLESHDLNEMVKEFVAYARPVYGKSGATFAVQLAGDLPPVRIDRALFRALLCNLATHAFHIRGDADIRISTLHDEKDKLVLLKFCDNGRIKADRGGRSSFSPLAFDQLDDSKGYGLFICAGIARRHGGHFSVCRPKGKETQITVALPVS